MKKWIALGLGLTSVAVTATTMVTNRGRLKNLIKPQKEEKVPETVVLIHSPRMRMNIMRLQVLRKGASSSHTPGRFFVIGK